MEAILDFAKQRLTLDQVTLPMKPHDQFLDPELMQAQFSTVPQEPVFTRNATKHTVEILDAKYEKADVAKIVSKNRHAFE